MSAIAIGLAGNTTTSADISVTVNNPLLLLHLDQTEVSGVTNGSTVMPSIAPAGFTGAVVANGTGSVNYTPAEAGNGVYFLNCCVNSNNAYYRFSGSTVGNIFNMSQGQITFYLKSRYSFAQRTANAAGPRYAFDVRDGSGNHLFYFLTQVSGGLLFFNYGVGGMGMYTYLQPGTEDAQFGNGVILQVQLTWSGNVTNLYLNGSLVKSVPYTAATANWSSGSVFDVGAYEYQTYGGFYGLDDVIDEFTVVGPTTGLTSPPPVVSMTAPVNGATVGGTVMVTANATDNVGITGLQFQLDERMCLARRPSRVKSIVIHGIQRARRMGHIIPRFGSNRHRYRGQYSHQQRNGDGQQHAAAGGYDHGAGERRSRKRDGDRYRQRHG